MSVDLSKSDNGASSLYGGRPPQNSITDTFTVDEWRIIKDGLMEGWGAAKSNAKFQEEMLNKGCRSNKIDPKHYCDDCRLADHERAGAELRAMKYDELAAKIKV